MNQHDFVAGALAFYKAEGFFVGDGQVWVDAHYPAPDGLGTDTIKLLWEHHQIQGILQSEEYGRCCFFAGDAKRFLDQNFGCEGWFDLWNLYEKWASDQAKKNSATTHSLIDAEGKSIRARRAGAASHRRLDANGKSARMRAINDTVHTEKDERGRSLSTLRMNEVVHAERDEDGKSLHAKRASELANAPRRQALEVTCIETGESWSFPSLCAAGQSLGLSPGSLSLVVRELRKSHRGFTARLL